MCIKNLYYLFFNYHLHIYKVFPIKKIAFFLKFVFTFLNKKGKKIKVFEKNAVINNVRQKSIKQF